MQGVIYKDSAKGITLEQALEAFEAGIILEVNDGKHVTMSIEKEPTSREAE